MKPIRKEEVDYQYGGSKSLIRKETMQGY